ncbi:MAG: hypothetical protein QM770_18455 [Tepidisphaeraceae bacterium]
MAEEVDRRQFLKAVGAGLFVLGGAPTLLKSQPAKSDAITSIGTLAAASEIATYRWADRGKAPAGYVKGMAVSYAKCYHDLSTGKENVVEMAKAVGEDPAKDALAHYAEVFQQAGLDNSKDGVDTLRHLFVLMLGLGMRESSGRYCEGRDRSADNTTAETAEAGLFQTSFNARRASPLLPKLFTDFQAKPVPSYLDVFKEGVRAKESDLENFGAGDGKAFQEVSKTCPFFAVVFAGIGLRNIRKHWGPINRRAAQIRPEADRLFADVQALVDRDKLGPQL